MSTTIWMNLEKSMPTERRQTQKATDFRIPLQAHPQTHSRTSGCQWVKMDERWAQVSFCGDESALELNSCDDCC